MPMGDLVSYSSGHSYVPSHPSFGRSGIDLLADVFQPILSQCRAPLLLLRSTMLFRFVLLPLVAVSLAGSTVAAPRPRFMNHAHNPQMTSDPSTADPTADAPSNATGIPTNGTNPASSMPSNPTTMPIGNAGGGASNTTYPVSMPPTNGTASMGMMNAGNSTIPTVTVTVTVTAGAVLPQWCPAGTNLSGGMPPSPSTSGGSESTGSAPPASMPSLAANGGSSVPGSALPTATSSAGTGQPVERSTIKLFSSRRKF
ncbi:hypothetical protein BU15DRAFT_71691 [Melanogaster broomeanus]|nr:hypothetical protein BU15DRAFT_71691 [Melanogaster broomeanus]